MCVCGWWSGTFFSPYIGNVIIPTDELHHFSEGYTTNQYILILIIINICILYEHFRVRFRPLGWIETIIRRHAMILPVPATAATVPLCGVPRVPHARHHAGALKLHGLGPWNSCG